MILSTLECIQDQKFDHFLISLHYSETLLRSLQENCKSESIFIPFHLGVFLYIITRSRVGTPECEGAHTLPFYVLLHLLRKEADLLHLYKRLVGEGKLKRYQRKSSRKVI